MGRFTICLGLVATVLVPQGGFAAADPGRAAKNAAMKELRRQYGDHIAEAQNRLHIGGAGVGAVVFPSVTQAGANVVTAGEYVPLKLPAERTIKECDVRAAMRSLEAARSVRAQFRELVGPD